MNQLETNPAEALSSMESGGAMLAARQALTNDGGELERLAATPDEIEELISGVADTLLVIRDRALESISRGDIEQINRSLTAGPDVLTANMLAWDADPEVDCQCLYRTLILRSQGRRTDEGYWESETDEDAVAFEEAFDDGIASTGAIIQKAAMVFFAPAAISLGWDPAKRPPE